VTVRLNGEAVQLSDGASVADVIARLGVAAGRGFAVAVDGEVVPHGQWKCHTLHDAARVEVVTALQGG